MMSKTKEESKPLVRQQRHPYEKPALNRVELRAEEAFLGGCKTGFIAGPAQATCDAAGDCSSITS